MRPRTIGLICCLPILVLAACTSPNYVERQRLEFEITTSSDWTVLQFDKPTRVTGLTIVECDPAGTCNRGQNRVELSQPIERAEDGKQVLATGTIDALDMFGRLLSFRVGRGHLGTTTVRLYLVTQSGTSFVGEYSWSGIDEKDPRSNEARFLVDVTESDRHQAE